MRRNQKLTRVLQGRALVSSEQIDGATILAFDDGSKMKIKTAPQQAMPTRAAPSREVATKVQGADAGEAKLEAKPQSAPRKVVSVRQQETDFSLEFDDGTSLALQTLEESASVMLRDKNGAMEYAD